MRSTETPSPTPSPVIETKPVAEGTSRAEIRPSKPVTKSTKQLSSVVRVVSANPVASNVNNTPKPVSSKVQIVSSHVEVIDESKKSLPKSVVHAEAIDVNSNSRTYSTILPSRVEIVGGVSPSESYVDCLINSLNCFILNLQIKFLNFMVFCC